MPSGQGTIEQRHKTHRPQDVPGKALFFTDDQHQLLHLPCPHRNHQAPARRELIEQGLGDIGGDGSDDDAVIGRQRRPAFPAVALAGAGAL